jgi:hypothetical protein
MTTESYGPALGSFITIDAPKRSCHGKQGRVKGLLLQTNEAVVELIDGKRYTLPWDSASEQVPHGTRQRYRHGCSCLECCEAVAKYIQEHPTRKSSKPHGTRGRYRAGCKCAECRAADLEYKRQWRSKQ